MKHLGQTFAVLLSFSAPLQAGPPNPSTLAEIPLLGFGTWNLDRSNASEVITTAFKSGYRHFDCAAVYGNEKEVGKGIKDAGVKREEFWVTSKLWNDQ